MENLEALEFWETWKGAQRDTEQEWGILDYWVCVCHNGMPFVGDSQMESEHARAYYYGMVQSI